MDLYEYQARDVFEKHGVTVLRGITAVTRHSDHMDVFWVGPDGGIGTNWWHGKWGKPFGIAPPGAAAIGSGIAATSRNSRQLDVFWVGPDGGIGSA